MSPEVIDRTRQPPFDRWPVQHFDPRYGFCWYCGDGLIVSHLNVHCGTQAAAEAYHDFEEAILESEAREIVASGGLFVIHDWRSMQTYEPGARHHWQQRMQARRKGYLRGSVVCVARAGPLLRMAVQAVNLFASVTQNGKVELARDVDRVLQEHHVTPPGARRKPG
jgi:hypothetical protein